MTVKKRRERGTGNVRPDPTRPGSWIGAIQVDGRRYTVRGRNKSDVSAKLAQAKAEALTGTGRSKIASNVTVAETVATFLERDIPNRRSGGRPLAPATVEVYRWTSEIITEQIGRVKLANLSVHSVEAMLDRLANRPERPLGAASLRKVRGTLQRAIRFAERRGDIGRNVAAYATITPSATAGAKRKSLAPGEARQLIVALRDERNGAMFALSLFLGLRPGEAAGLYWCDVEGTTVNVTRGVRLTHGRPEVVDDLKTESSRRTIEMPADLIGWLADHRREQIAERLASGAWADDRLVFASPRGNVLSPPNIRRHLREVCARAGLPVVRPNELRHSCASLLSDRGVPNESIADLLGHTTTRMVDQTYRHRLRPVVDVAAQIEWATEHH